MKRLHSIGLVLLLVALAASLSACGNKGELVRPAPKTVAG